MTNKPKTFCKATMDDGSDVYKCLLCHSEVDENGDCLDGAEPCYYCPPETCGGCGRGFCDQSC